MHRIAKLAMTLGRLRQPQSDLATGSHGGRRAQGPGSRGDYRDQCHGNGLRYLECRSRSSQS